MIHFSICVYKVLKNAPGETWDETGIAMKKPLKND
jgi:hypothetical protein